MALHSNFKDETPEHDGPFVMGQGSLEDWIQGEDYIEKLEAENKRFRAALERILGNGDATGCNPQNFCNIAREALK